MLNFCSNCDGRLEINLRIIYHLSCTTWFVIRKWDLSVGFTVPRIIWIIMYVAHTYCVLQNALSSRGHVRWQANLGRNDESTMDVRKLARSETINTGTDSTARFTGRVRGAGISAYTLPWSLGVSLRHRVVVRTSSFSSYVNCSIPRTYMMGQNRLALFRTHFSLRCGVGGILHTEEERMSCHVMSYHVMSYHVKTL
jgi:hypothetical protein